MKKIGFLGSSVLVLLLAIPAAEAQRCLPLPPESPVPSYSPDDIPATNIDIITYTGALAKARANHNFCFVEMSPNDQRVWFGVGLLGRSREELL